jgi:twitching motility protein PilT
MQTMNQHLFHLINKKEINVELALLRSPDPEELRQMINRGSPDVVQQRKTTPVRPQL